MGIGLDRFIDVEPVIETHRPLLKLLERLRGGIAQPGIRAGFFHQRQPIFRKGILVADVIQRADGVSEAGFTRLERADFVEWRCRPQSSGRAWPALRWLSSQTVAG